MSSSFLQFRSSYYTPVKERENNTKVYLGVIGLADTVLLAALQLKYQGNDGSSFKDQPEAMAIAIASFLLSCMGCIIEQNYLRTTCLSPTLSTLLHQFVRLMGYISLASLAIVLFSTSASSNISLIAVYLTFSLFVLAFWMLQWIRNKGLHRNRDSLPVYLRLQCTFDKLLQLPEFESEPRD